MAWLQHDDDDLLDDLDVKDADKLLTESRSQPMHTDLYRKGLTRIPCTIENLECMIAASGCSRARNKVGITVTFTMCLLDSQEVKQTCTSEDFY